MKRSVQSYLCAFALALAFAAHGQGTFQNLGFESATLVPIPGDSYQRVFFDSAFPGWTGYVGEFQQTSALYNLTFLDSSGIALIDGGFTGNFGTPVRILGGNFTAILQAGLLLGSSTTPADTTLSQTSLVPVSAESLRFRAFASPFGSVRVSLGGQALTLTTLTSSTNYTLFGADIHAWQGQVARLDFTVIAQRPHVSNINMYLDSIQFSSVPIPEPRIVGMLGLGVSLLVWRRRHRSSS